MEEEKKRFRKLEGRSGDGQSQQLSGPRGVLDNSPGQQLWGELEELLTF